MFVEFFERILVDLKFGRFLRSGAPAPTSYRQVFLFYEAAKRLTSPTCWCWARSGRLPLAHLLGLLAKAVAAGIEEDKRQRTE